MFKNNKIIIGSSVPFEWKKEITFNNLERRGTFTKFIEKSNFLKTLCIFLPTIFTYRKDEFFITDYLIIGDNPFINLLLLKKISEESLEYKKNVNVLILDQHDTDYWGYHIIKIYENKYNEFLNILENINFEYVNLYLLKSNMEYSYSHEYNKGFLVFLTEYKKVKNFFEENMPNIFLSLSNIKKSFKYLINSKLKKNYGMNFIYFSKKNPKIITKNIFFTTFNKSINYEIKEGNFYYLNESFECMNLESKFKKVSFGSASKIPKNFLNFNELVCSELEQLKNINLNYLRKEIKK
jgi:hypothetical protein